MFDDLTSFVVDIGTHSARLGYGGDDAPKIIAPSYITCKTAMDNEQRQLAAGDRNLSLDRGDIQVESIFKKHGDDISYRIEENNYEAFLEFMLNKQLKINTQDYSILFSQDVNLKPNQLLAQRQKIAQIAFEKLGAPNIFFLKSPVLACFATGRSTAVVVDSGQNSTRITPVHEGFVLNKNSKISNCGGKQLTQQFERYIEKQIGQQIQSRFELSGADYTDSFRAYHKKNLLEDIKSSCSPNSLSSQENTEMSEKIFYELPDKQTIKIQKNQIKDLFISPPEEYLSIPTAIVETINNTDVDIKKELYSNILMTGGNFIYNGQGLQNQVISNVGAVAPPNVKIKSVSLCMNSERKTLSWIGGSIVSCLSAFQSYWIGKEQFLSGGVNVLERKCL